MPVDSAERVVKYLVARGWTAGRVDRQQGPRHKEDWPGHSVGFADVLAVKPPHWMLVQSCTYNHHADHVRTMKASAYVIGRCVESGCIVELWTWKAGIDEPRRERFGSPETWQDG